MTQWVAKAWERLHIENRQTIIDTFRHVGLSLNPNGSEDSELKIQDLPGITVSDYNQASTPRCEGLQMEEDEAEVTTDSSNDTESHFDEEDSDSDFDEALDGDEDAGDCNMRWFGVLFGALIAMFIKVLLLEDNNNRFWFKQKFIVLFPPILLVIHN